MSGLLMALVHPATQAAWTAVNSPAVLDSIGGLLGADASGRRLGDYAVNGGGVIDALGGFFGGGDVPGRRLETYVELTTAAYVGAAVGIVVPIVIWAIIAMLYKTKVTDARQPLPQPVLDEFSLRNGDFKYGFCSCFDDIHYCLHGCCCEVILAGDVYQAAGIKNFWFPVIVYFGCWAVSQAIALVYMIILAEINVSNGQVYRGGNGAYYLTGIIFALMMANLRKSLREKLGDPQPGKSCAMDFLLYWCCGCCTVVQDARQVDGATGVLVRCCCSLQTLMQQPMPPVGAPMTVNVQPAGQPVVVGNVIG